jgi:hypothetical protein
MEWKSVFKDNNLIKAELIKNEFNERGIKAIIVNGVDSNYPILGYAEVMVFHADFEEALIVLNNMEFNEE